MKYPEDYDQFLGRCPDCNCSIYGKQDEVKFTGPADCRCWLPEEEGGEEDED